MRSVLLALISILLFFGTTDPAVADPAKPRLMALGAPVVEIVFALGLGDGLVGRTEWTAWPPGVEKIPSVGSPGTPNMELILRLKPDLILADPHYAMLQKRLEPHGIDVWLIDAYNEADIPAAVEKIAKRFGKEEQGQSFLAAISEPTDIIQSRLADLSPRDRKRGLMISGAAMFFSFSDTSGRRFLESAGSVNLTAGLTSPYPQLSKEWVVLSRPDFLVYVPPESGSPDNDLRRDYIDAVESGLPVPPESQVIVLDGPLTYGPRATFGALILATHLYPDRFADIEPESIYGAFLERVYGLKAGDAQDKVYLP